MSIIFLPKSNNCAVNSIYQLLSNDIERIYDLHYLNLKEKELKSEIKNSKIVFFAHPDEEKLGFSNSIGYYPLMPRDFKFNEDELKTLGFVCFGSYIFSNSYWSNCTKEWISFNSGISICTGYNQIDNYWIKYFSNLLEDFSSDTETKLLSNIILKRIHNEIKVLGNQENLGSQVIIACLGSMSNSLATHDKS